MVRQRQTLERPPPAAEERLTSKDLTRLRTELEQGKAGIGIGDVISDILWLLSCVFVLQYFDVVDAIRLSDRSHRYRLLCVWW